jgi:hypothetical protein
VGRSIRLVVVALVAALAVAACGGKEPAAEQTVAPGVSAPTVVDGGTLAAGEKIAAPTGEVVLTVTGAIGEHTRAGSSSSTWPAWSACAGSGWRRPSRSSSAG